MAPSESSQTAMSREELSVFLQEWFCGCGNPEDAADALLRLLRLHPMYEHGKELDEWVGDNGLAYLLLYSLDRYDLTEHGGSVMGAWLTEKGTAVRDALAREEADEFEELFTQRCVHGFDIDDESHDCMAADG